jgi:hypothetical protein
MAPSKTPEEGSGLDATENRGGGGGRAVEAMEEEGRDAFGEEQVNSSASASASAARPLDLPRVAMGTEIGSNPMLISTPTVPPPSGFLFRRSGAVAPPPISQKVHHTEGGEQHVHWRLSKKDTSVVGVGRGASDGGTQGPQSGSFKHAVSFSLNDTESTPLLNGNTLIQEQTGVPTSSL